MSIDVYLQLEGIKGESSDSQHQGWIECTMADWMITQPKSACGSSAGGHTAGRCEHSTLALNKLADLSSPILLQHCSMGKTIPSARIEYRFTFMNRRSDLTDKYIRQFNFKIFNPGPRTIRTLSKAQPLRTSSMESGQVSHMAIMRPSTWVRFRTASTSLTNGAIRRRSASGSFVARAKMHTEISSTPRTMQMHSSSSSRP